MKPKVWSRKGRCPGCNVATGSRHSRGCSFHYVPTKSNAHITQPSIRKALMQDQLFAILGRVLYFALGAITILALVSLTIQ